ncbi:MAG: hypothetical protein HZA53_17405 [Planctomycetes bacterium]|nr:hypothetical protein [Planctomycetota bacterium]
MQLRTTRTVRSLLALALLVAPTSMTAAQSIVITQDTLDTVSTVSSGGGVPAVLVTTGLGGLSGPLGVRRGPDNLLYVVNQSMTNKVLRYFPDGTQDTSFVLPATAGLTTPIDVAFHPIDKRMYLTDLTGKVFVYDKDFTSLATTITSTAFTSAAFLCFDPAGECFFTDPTGLQVLKLPSNSFTPSVIVPATSGAPTPMGIAYGGTRLYVGTWGPNQVLMYSTAGVALGVEAALAIGDQPCGITVDDLGKVHVACRGANNVQRFDPNGGGNALTVCAITTPVGLDFVAPMRAPFPLRKGELVTTCFGDGQFLHNWTNPLDLCVKVVDVRAGGPTGVHWPAPMFSNEYPPGPNTWNYQNLGEVFGLTLDDAEATNIFVAASTSFGFFPPGPSGPGGVYKLGGCDGRIYPWLVTGTGALLSNTLPNTGPGLGNICHDRRHQQFFVSNFEDGKIYRVKDLGTKGSVVQVYDPFGPDLSGAGFAPLGERVWAVHVSSDYDPTKLFFSVWLRDEFNTNTGWPTDPAWGPAPLFPNNAIFAVALDAQGAITGTPVLWKVMPHLSATLKFSNPVSDITSSPRLLYFAERTMYGDYGTPFMPDESRLTRMFFPQNGFLMVNGLEVGDGGTPGWNCAGGVAVTFDGDLHAYSSTRVWTTGEQLHGVPGDIIDGLQSIRFNGNLNDSPYTLKSKLVDLDGFLLPYHRTVPGDVEYVRKNSSMRHCPSPSGGGGGGIGSGSGL